MPAAGHLAYFLDELRSSGLLEPERLAEVLRDPLAADGEDPKPLARKIHERGWMTRFQLKQIAKGAAKELILGPYRLLDRVGSGGMGDVYKARHQPMNRIVALKLIRPDRLANQRAVARFHQEVKVAAQLLHPNIVCAYDAGEVGGTHYFAMEFVDGVDLHEFVLVSNKGPLPVAEACDYIRQAAIGLQYAQERGVVHRDIKPSNLLVTRPPPVSASTLPGGAVATKATGQRAVVKILDMGLARLGEMEEDNRITRDEMAMGTPEYMAPEQARNSRLADTRSDLYSLGCTMQFLLTGKSPFQAPTLAQLLLKHQMDPPPKVEDLRPEVPPAVGAIVRKLLAKKAEDRFQTPGELAEALEPFCRGESGEVDWAKARRRGEATGDGVWETLGGGDSQGEDDEPMPKRRRAASLDKTELVAEPEEEPEVVRPRKRRKRKAADNRVLLYAAIGSGAVVLLAAALLVIALRGGRSNQGTAAATTPASPPATSRVVVVDPGNGGKPKDGAPPIPPPQGNPVPPTQVAAGQIVGIPGQIYAVLFTTDNNRVLHSWNDNVFALRDLKDPKPIRVFGGHTGMVMSLALSPDGRRVLSGSRDGTMRLWELDTGRSLREYHGHQGQQFKWVRSVAFSPNGRQALSGGNEDKTMLLWDLDGDQPVRKFVGHTGGIFRTAFSPDGRKALSAGDRTVRLWDVETGAPGPSIQLPGNVYCAAFTTDGRQVVAGSDDGLHLYDAASGVEQLHRFEMPAGMKQVFCLAVSPDGRRLLSGATDKMVRLWDVATGRPLAVFQGHSEIVWSVAFSRDGRRAVSGSNDNSLRVWDLPK